MTKVHQLLQTPIQRNPAGRVRRYSQPAQQPTASAEPAMTDDIAGLRRILAQHRTIAVVGLSAEWYRPSYFAAKYMQDHGYRVIPVNPRYAEVLGRALLSERSTTIPEPVDIVDVFRQHRRRAADRRRGDRQRRQVLWMQLGVSNDEAARIARDAGLDVGDGPLREDRARAHLRRPATGRASTRGVHLGAAARCCHRADAGHGRPQLPARHAGMHAGQIPDAATGARALPIYQTTSFVFDSADHAASLFNLQTFGNVYSRMSNPTVAALEERMAALEGGRAALASRHRHGGARRWRC